MGAVAGRVRGELTGRWRGWLSVALIIGLFGGAAGAAAGGARRTSTAYTRLIRASRTPDLRVEEFIPNPETAVLDPRAVAGVAGVVESDDFRDFAPTENININIVASADGRAFGTGLSQLKLLSGHRARPDNPTEAVADFSAGFHLGQRVTYHAVAATHGDPHQPDLKAPGIPFEVTVVGLVAVPGQFPPYDPNGYYAGANLYLTPAFYRAHEHVAGFDLSLVRVAPGRLSAVERGINALAPGGQVSAYVELAPQSRLVERSTRLEGTALLILACLLGFIGLVIVGQLLARQTLLEATDNGILRAIGVTRRQLVAVALVRSGVVGCMAAVTAVAVAIALSPFTPVGIARTAEPHSGLAVNLAVLAMAAGMVIAVTVLLTVAPAIRAAAGAGTGASVAQRERPSVISDAAASAGLSPALTTGVRMALTRGRGRTGVPVWSTIVGVVLGIATLVASLTFGASLHRLIATPRLFGVVWDQEILNNNGPQAVPPAVPIVRADPDVLTAAYIQTGMGFRVNGHDYEGTAFEVVKGAFKVVTLEGRQPAGDHDLVLGTKTMRSLHTRIGAVVTGIAESDVAKAVTVDVVGRGVLPPGTAGGQLGEGIIATRATLLRMAGGQVRSPYVIAVHFRPGIDQANASRRLEAELGKVDDQFTFRSPATPTDLVNFGRVENLPFLLGGMMAALGALTLVHLLITSIRRRRRDLAVLRIIGFVRAQVIKAVVWQTTTIVVAGLAFGVPAGIVVGRFGWAVFATQLGVLSEPVTPMLPILVVIAATVALGNLIAIGPGVLAARPAPASVLRLAD